MVTAPLSPPSGVSDGMLYPSQALPLPTRSPSRSLRERTRSAAAKGFAAASAAGPAAVAAVSAVMTHLATPRMCTPRKSSSRIGPAITIASAGTNGKAWRTQQAEGAPRSPLPRWMQNNLDTAAPHTRSGALSVGAAAAANGASEVKAAGKGGEGGANAEEHSDSDVEEHVHRSCWEATTHLLLVQSLDFVVEAFEAGAIQMVLLFLLPLIVSLSYLVSLMRGSLRAFVGSLSPPTIGAPSPPPAAPPPPNGAAEIFASLWDFAFAHPAVYFALNFGLLFSAAAFFLFLDDIHRMLEVRPALRIHRTASPSQCIPIAMHPHHTAYQSHG